MPLALIVLAAFLIMTGITGQYAQVGQQFNDDVIGQGGQGGFLSYLEGIIGISIFFRIIGMPNAGRIFLILVIVAYLIANQGVLAALQSFASGGNSAALDAAASIPTTGVPSEAAK